MFNKHQDSQVSWSQLNETNISKFYTHELQVVKILIIQFNAFRVDYMCKYESYFASFNLL